MTPEAAWSPVIDTLADLHECLGCVPLYRIRCQSAPGTATEADVLVDPQGEKRLYELGDGVLVEKPRGYDESLLAALLIRCLGSFLDRHDLGEPRRTTPGGCERLANGRRRAMTCPGTGSGCAVGPSSCG